MRLLFESYFSYNRMTAFAAILFQVTTITPQDALQLVGSADVCFLDVRETYEYEAGHIPGRYLMPWNSGVLQSEWQSLPTDRPLIVYCAAGSRSASAAQFLNEKNFADVRNISGGFSAYRLLSGAIVEIGPYQPPETAILNWMVY
jgi:rhodanese-related sulfurtransferase